MNSESEEPTQQDWSYGKNNQNGTQNDHEDDDPTFKNWLKKYFSKKGLYKVGNKLESALFYSAVIISALFVNFALIGTAEPLLFLVSSAAITVAAITTTFLLRRALEWTTRIKKSLYDPNDSIFKFDSNAITSDNSFKVKFALSVGNLTAHTLDRQRAWAGIVLGAILTTAIVIGVPLLLNAIGVNVDTSWIPSLITDFFGNHGGLAVDHFSIFGKVVAGVFASVASLLAVALTAAVTNFILNAVTVEKYSKNFKDSNDNNRLTVSIIPKENIEITYQRYNPQLPERKWKTRNPDEDKNPHKTKMENSVYGTQL